MNLRLSDNRLLDDSARQEWLESVDEAIENAELSHEDFLNLSEAFDRLTDLNIDLSIKPNVSNEAIVSRLAYSLESIGFGESEVRASLESSDGVFAYIKNTIRAIWEAIKKALLSIIQWVKRFYDRYFGQAGEIVRNCNKAREILRKKSSSVPQSNVVTVKDVEFLFTGNDKNKTIGFTRLSSDLSAFGTLRRAFNDVYLVKVSATLKQMLSQRSGGIDISDRDALRVMRIMTAESLAKFNAKMIGSLMGSGVYDPRERVFTTRVIGDLFFTAKDYVVDQSTQARDGISLTYQTAKVAIATDYRIEKDFNEIKFQAFTPSMIVDLIDFVEKIYSIDEMKKSSERIKRIEAAISEISRWAESSEKIALKFAEDDSKPANVRREAVSFFRNQLRLKDAATNWTSMVMLQFDTAAVKISRCCIRIAQAHINNLK